MHALRCKDAELAIFVVIFIVWSVIWYYAGMLDSGVRFTGHLSQMQRDSVACIQEMQLRDIDNPPCTRRFRR